MSLFSMEPDDGYFSESNKYTRQISGKPHSTNLFNFNVCCFFSFVCGLSRS